MQKTRIRRRFDRLAGSYDWRWRGWVGQTVRETLDRVDLEGVGAVLDVGCGTGTLFATIAPEREDARLTGLDLSPAMLTRARDKVGPGAGWVCGDAARLPFRTGSFDLVFSLSALHHWADPAAGLGEIRRILRPGGRVAITDWSGDMWTMRLRSRVLGLFDPAPLQVHRADDLTDLLAAAGFGWIRVERWRLGWSWEMMTAVAATPSAGP